MLSCVSELTHIVPLASGAVTLNLAYLNLDHFRYAKAILSSAEEGMDRVEKVGKDTKLDFTNALSYRQLQALAALPGKGKIRGLGFSIGLTRILFIGCFVWPTTDRIICTVFVIAATVALVLGTGHPIGALLSTCELFNRDNIFLSYWLLVAGVVSPMGFLVLGGFIQRRCRKIAEHVEGDFGQVMQESVQTAEVAEDPGQEETP